MEHKNKSQHLFKQFILIILVNFDYYDFEVELLDLDEIL
jgi:hypothetical protein